jgi:hypothetical protein
MPDRSDIFAKRRLTVGQLRAVADRRFGDAEALVATGDNARANGAQYLAGIVVEIRLKAELVRMYPSVARQRPHDVKDAERRVWNMIWRSHNLTEMLEQATTLRASVDAAGERAGRPYFEWLADICGRWTVFARYTSVTRTMGEARSMLERVRLLKEVM